MLIINQPNQNPTKTSHPLLLPKPPGQYKKSKMGDCASRPTASEIETHKSLHLVQNDRYFSYINLPISSPTLTYLHRKKREYERKLKLQSSNSPTSYLYLIEVQKLSGIHQPGLCFDHEKPFLSVSLEPNGPYQETCSSDLFRPKWFRLVQFKSVVLFKHIKIDVVGEKGYFFGSLKVSVEELIDQKVVDEWFPFELGDMKVKLRLQVVFDEKKLYEALLEEIKELIEKLKDFD